MEYNKPFSSGSPGLIIYLLDQSDSMNAPYGKDESKSKAEYCAEILMNLTQEVVLNNLVGDQDVIDRAFIVVIGYGGNGYDDEGSAKIILHEPLSEIANILEKNYDNFIKPIANGITPMHQAFKKANNIINNWIGLWEEKSLNPISEFPSPVIMNISDGMPGYQGLGEKAKEDVKLEINNILHHKFDDGIPLIFNIHISSDIGETIILPDQISSDSDESIKFFFDISSNMPEQWRRNAQVVLKGNDFVDQLTSETKLVSYQTDSKLLIKLLRFGTGLTPMIPDA